MHFDANLKIILSKFYLWHLIKVTHNNDIYGTEVMQSAEFFNMTLLRAKKFVITSESNVLLSTLMSRLNTVIISIISIKIMWYEAVFVLLIKCYRVTLVYYFRMKYVLQLLHFVAKNLFFFVFLVKINVCMVYMYIFNIFPWDTNTQIWSFLYCIYSYGTIYG